MTRIWATVSILVLSFLGIANTAYLTGAELTHTALSCSVTGFTDCALVAQSPYAHLFGVPVASYGFVFYSVVFSLAAALLLLASRSLRIALQLLACAGFIASDVFMVLQLLVIHAMCMYCIASAILSFLICIVALWLPARLPRSGHIDTGAVLA